MASSAPAAISALVEQWFSEDANTASSVVSQLVAHLLNGSAHEARDLVQLLEPQLTSFEAPKRAKGTNSTTPLLFKISFLLLQPTAQACLSSTSFLGRNPTLVALA